MKIYSKELDETLYHSKHASGLDIYCLPKRGYSKSYALLAAKYGSIDSEFAAQPGGERIVVPDGVAHFLEHKMFEQADGGNVFDEFSRRGANANAFTGFNMTGYLFSSATDFYENLKTLVSFVQSPYFTDENVAKEQGIIGQEIRMYQDDPNWRSYFNVIGGMYSRHSVRKDIAGSLDSIARIDKEVLYKCYETFYHPSNMLLFCVGNIDADSVCETADKTLIPKEPRGGIERFYADEPAKIAQTYIEQSLEVSQPLFYVGFKGGADESNLLKREIETQIALKIALGKSSPLYRKMYDQGLINATFGAEETVEPGYCHCLMGGESPQPEKAADMIAAGFEDLRTNGIDAESYERVRRVIYGKYIKGFNNVEAIANNFTGYLFKDINLFDYIETYRQVTCDDVMARLSDFTRDKMALSVVKK